MLLEASGNLRLSDFGLSKEGVRDNVSAHSFCGTPEYLAPEILNRAGHGRAADWWSLGALLYEMLTGMPPFYSRTRERLFEKILHAELRIPRFFSAPARSLLLGLLDRDPSTRLGSADEDAAEIKRHPFFADIDWEKLLAKKIRPPFQPVFQQKEASRSAASAAATGHGVAHAAAASPHGAGAAAASAHPHHLPIFGGSATASSGAAAASSSSSSAAAAAAASPSSSSFLAAPHLDHQNSLPDTSNFDAEFTSMPLIDSSLPGAGAHPAVAVDPVTGEPHRPLQRGTPAAAATADNEPKFPGFTYTNPQEFSPSLSLLSPSPLRRAVQMPKQQQQQQTQPYALALAQSQHAQLSHHRPEPEDDDAALTKELARRLHYQL